MRIELLREREELAALAPEWNRLAAADRRDGFFRSFQWYRAWMTHIRSDAEPYVVVVRDRSGQMVGLAPLCRVQYNDLGFRLGTVGWAGREVVSGDYLDFLAEDNWRCEVTAAILNHLWTLRDEWNMLQFGELVEGGHSHIAVRTMAERNGLAVRKQEERICPYIALPQSFEDYLGSLGGSTRYHIRRRIRDVLEKQGGRIEVCSRPKEIGAHLETLERLHVARWRKDSLPGTLGRAGFAAFLKEICTAPPPGASCRLYMLSRDNIPAAALLTFWFGESALYYQAGWDPDGPLAALSPGVVVMAQSIRDAIESGLAYYDFLRGDEAYKCRWTKTYRTTSTLLCARSLPARSYLRVCRLKDVLKQQLGKSTSTAGHAADQLVSSSP